MHGLQADLYVAFCAAHRGACHIQAGCCRPAVLVTKASVKAQRMSGPVLLSLRPNGRACSDGFTRRRRKACTCTCVAWLTAFAGCSVACHYVLVMHGRTRHCLRYVTGSRLCLFTAHQIGAGVWLLKRQGHGLLVHQQRGTTMVCWWYANRLAYTHAFESL